MHREIRHQNYMRRTKHVATLLAAFALGYFIKGYRDARVISYPVEEWRDVKVFKQLDRATWQMRGKPVRYGAMQAEDDLILKCCPDFDCTSVTWPYYHMDHIKFEERGWCKSILAAGLGTFWDMDAQNHIMKIDVTGQLIGYETDEEKYGRAPK